MRVILRQTVPKVGKEGQVVRVKDGFARNFLFPRRMAIVADKAQLRVLEARNKKLAAELEATKAAGEQTAEKLDSKHVRMEVRSGSGQRLFGAVTAQDIANAVKEQLGVAIDRKIVGILQPIKQLGHFNVEIDLHRHIDCRIVVDVVDPQAEEQERLAAEVRKEEEAAAAAAAADSPVEEPSAEVEAQEAPEDAPEEPEQQETSAVEEESSE